MLSKIDQLNGKLSSMKEQPEEDDICVFSLDAEALYPSLDTMACSKLCGDMVKDSKLEVSGMDPKWASLYLALLCTQAEITCSCLADIVPSRR